jgi:hypothetical protein
MADEMKRTWTEAPASWNIRYRISGFDEQITLRGESYAELVTHIDAARAYVGKLIGAAPSAKTAIEAINVDAQPGDLEYTPISDSQPATPLTFEADKLSVTVSEGKKYVKVKGGKFQQFGVSVWPEVLKAAGIDWDKLDPMKGEYQIDMIALYALNEKGKPSKVTQLSKSHA